MLRRNSRGACWGFGGGIRRTGAGRGVRATQTPPAVGAGRLPWQRPRVLGLVELLVGLGHLVEGWDGPVRVQPRHVSTYHWVTEVLARARACHEKRARPQPCRNRAGGAAVTLGPRQCRSRLRPAANNGTGSKVEWTKAREGGWRRGGAPRAEASVGLRQCTVAG